MPPSLSPAHRPAAFLGLALAATLLPPTAEALDFSSPIAVHEDFEAEVAFPALPEIDVIGASTTVPWPDVPNTPSLTGSAAAIQVDSSELREGVEVDIDAELFSTLGDDVGLRGRYAALSFSGDGEGRILQALRMALDDAPLMGTTVAALLDLRQLGSLHQATLLIVEEQVGTAVPDHLAIQQLALPTATADLLFGGATFTIDLEIDRTASLAHASLEIDGGPAYTMTPLALSWADTSSLARATHLFENRSGGVIDIDVNLEEYTLFAVPAAYEPVLNVDVGTFWGAPSPLYGAAGPVGVWNQLAPGAQPLVDLAGDPTSTTATLGTASLGLIEANGGDVRALLADWARDPVEWTLAFDQLPVDGAYRVTVYTMGSGAAASGTLHANGASHPSLPGVVVPSLVEGDSYARLETIVALGELDVAGTANAGGEAHLSGIQLEVAVPLPEPGLSTALFAGVVAICGTTRLRR